MIQRSFKEPNFKCKVRDLDSQEYEWLTLADSEAELRERVEARTYQVLSITSYDFNQWKQKASDAKDAAIQAYDEGQEHKFKSDIWRELKLHLFELFDYKCAYCESRVLHVAPGDVEHYRPKKKVEEDSGHSGYYWLAYDVTNLFPCCIECNRARGKLNHFPIKGTRARKPEHDLSQESPLLLKPGGDEPDDPREHLRFAPGVNGVPVGTVAGKTDRGNESVKIYHLNRAELIVERRQEQEGILEKLEYLIVKDRTKYASIWEDLRTGAHQYSAAALVAARAWWQQLCADSGYS